MGSGVRFSHRFTFGRTGTAPKLNHQTVTDNDKPRRLGSLLYILYKDIPHAIDPAFQAQEPCGFYPRVVQTYTRSAGVRDMARVKFVQTNLYELYDFGAGYTADIFCEAMKKALEPRDDVVAGCVVVSTDTGREYIDIYGENKELKEVAETVARILVDHINDDPEEVVDLIDVEIPEGFEVIVADISEYDAARFFAVRRA